MKKIITLSGVKVANDALPRVSATPDERALASIPGLFAWLQAGPQFMTGAGELRDRASGDLLAPNASGGRVTQSTFPGGVPALDFPRPSARYRGATTKFAPDRWSIATVLQSSADPTTEELVSSPLAGVSGQFNVRMGFASGTDRPLRLWAGDGATRWTVPGQGWELAPTLIVVTFSVERGFTMRANGDQFDAVPDDRTPLAYGDWQIGTQAGGSGSVSSQAFNGKLGHLMLFNSDLGAPGNSGYLSVLESVLMDKYDIS